MGARRTRLAVALIAGAGLFAAGGVEAAPAYSWLGGEAASTVAASFAVPDGFRRVAVEGGSFGDWLRHLPLKPADSGVTLHDGRPVADHGTVAAVIDIDVGRSDLQQCADAVMRLRAEYLFSRRLTGPDRVRAVLRRALSLRGLCRGPNAHTVGRAHRLAERAAAGQFARQPAALARHRLRLRQHALAGP
jgi:hypothetical protein